MRMRLGRLQRRSDAGGADGNRSDAAGPAFGSRYVHAIVAVVAALLACVVAGCGGGRADHNATNSATKTFVDVADSYVRANQPHTNYGNNSEIFVDGSPPVRAYLEFQPFGPSTKIDRATLRLYTLSTSNEGFQVRTTPGRWSESGLTYRNAPSVGRLVSPSGAVVQNNWISIDVTWLVREHPGSVRLALVALGPTALTLASRRDKAHAPRLIVEYHRTRPPAARSDAADAAVGLPRQAA
jgi:hypothetical protein